MLEKIKCPERDSNPRHPDLMKGAQSWPLWWWTICSKYAMLHPRKLICCLSLAGIITCKIMKLKCKARRCLSLFSCNCVSRMTNYVNFKLSKDVEKNPGPTQYNTDHHEVIIRPFMQNHSSTMHFLWGFDEVRIRWTWFTIKRCWRSRWLFL